jgi:DNA-directed RNA polymerase subunit RPC12/RpoP
MYDNYLEMDGRLVAGGATMPNSTYFIQECPTCGRRLQIRVEYLGKRVRCQHCRGQFVATDPAGVRGDPAGQENALLRRADELLEYAAQQRPQPRSPYPR